MKKLLYLAACMWLVAPSVALADRENGLSVGVTGGYSAWDIATTGNKTSEKAPSFGVVARYTTPISDKAFAGVHAGWQKESISKKRSLGGAVLEEEVDWSFDALARIGAKMDSFSPYVAAGLSWAKGSGKISAGGVSLNDSNVHLGYKVAAGLDIPIADNASSFIQVEHAKYGDKTYKIGPLSGDFDLENLTVRLGLMYKF